MNIKILNERVRHQIIVTIHFCKYTSVMLVALDEVKKYQL